MLRPVFVRVSTTQLFMFCCMISALSVKDTSGNLIFTADEDIGDAKLEKSAVLTDLKQNHKHTKPVTQPVTVGSSNLVTEIVTTAVTEELKTTDIVTESTKHEKNCSHPKDNGHGLSNYRKWYYDEDDMICKPFTYKGSGGNGNRFRTRSRCMRTCNSRCSHDVPSSYSNGCDGGGFGWAYDQTRKECLPFRNDSCFNGYSYNDFTTKRECEQYCKYNGLTQPGPPPLCPPMNTRSSVCNSTYIVSGKVSSIFHEIYAEHLVHRLVVEVSDVHKGRHLLPLYTVDTDNNSTSEFIHIKKIITEGRNCHNINKAITYVFMGNMSYSNVLLDDNSYVKEERPSVLSKINTFIGTCS